MFPSPTVYLIPTITERQKRRKKTRSNNADTGTRRNAGTVKKKHGNTWKEVNSITTTIDHEKSSSLDFCLEEYKSDDENYPHRKKGTNSTPSFDDEYGDDNDCQDNSNSALVVAGEHNDRRQNMMQNNSEDKNNITSFTVPPVNILSARDLIDGGRLDGSGISRERANQLRHGGSKQPSNRHTSSSTSAHSAVNAKTDDDDDMVMPSIGGVTAGTGVRKIIYAARTHSQLSQFVGEVHRAAAAVIEKDIGVGRTNSRVGEIGKRGGRAVRVVALGGRKLLCSNQDVIFGRGRRTNQQRRSEAMITEKCLDLQKGISSSPSSAIVGTTLHDLNNSPTSIIAENGGRGVVQVKRHGEQSKRKRKNKTSCPLLASKEATSTLALHMLAKPSDIEDLAGLGDASTTCAYYASREALAAAEVVVVPYNTLLSSHSRQAVGLNLHQCLVIIDEAHNIPEALRSLSSCRLTLSAIQGADSQLSNYIQKYASRLAGKNLFYLGQIRRFLMSTTRYLTNAKPRTASNKSSSSKSSMVVTATELLFTLKLDNLNIFNVLRYLQKSRLAQKLHGFTSSTINADNDKNNDGTKEDGNHDLVSKHISAMSIVQEFLTFLTGSQRDGRVVIEWPAQAQTPTKNGAKHQSRSSYPVYPSFRYLLLNPASQFQNVVDEAHAVILIGGTIRPFSHMAAELFGSTNAKLVVQATTAEMKCTLQPPGSSFVSITPSLTTFKCGHVVPPSHVFTTRLSSGPTGVKLDFRHSSRSLHTVCDELGRSILNMCRVVPAGFVVFLPSYSYEGHLMARWNQTGLLQKLQKTKKLYREPKSSRDVEATLQLYSNNARLSKNGAILFCVIGGKMSEGINFANDMARCVFIVGLPYPDITDAELQEKMRLLDIDFQQKKIQISGQKYYHNLCMRAVNQSIGRAIRHAKDYAAIVLADARYASESKIWLALPEWIRSGGGMENSLQLPLSFGEKVTKIEAFFRDRSRNE